MTPGNICIVDCQDGMSDYRGGGETGKLAIHTSFGLNMTELKPAKLNVHGMGLKQQNSMRTYSIGK